MDEKNRGAGVSACFPAFNDGGAIAWVARRAEAALRPTGREFEILILNDGSTDQTAAVLARLAREIPQVRTLAHEENQGYGATLRDLFAAARFPLVVYTDGDGQFDPFELTELLDAATADVQFVNGFRRSRADGPLRRLLGPRFHQVIARTFGLPDLKDWDCDFRLFRRDLGPDRLMSFDDGTAVVEFLAALGDRGVRFAEVEVSHHERRAGESQYFRPRSVIAGHRNLIRLWRRRGRPPVRWREWWNPPESG